MFVLCFLSAQPFIFHLLYLGHWYNICALKKLAPQVYWSAYSRCNTWGAKGKCNSAAKNQPSTHTCMGWRIQGLLYIPFKKTLKQVLQAALAIKPVWNSLTVLKWHGLEKKSFFHLKALGLVITSWFLQFPRSKVSRKFKNTAPWASTLSLGAKLLGSRVKIQF